MHAAQPPVVRHSTHWKSRRYLPNVLFLRHPEAPPRPQRGRLPRFVRMACAPCLQWWRRKLGPALRLAALGPNHVPQAHRCFRRVRAFEDVHVACCVLFDGQLPAAQCRALPVCSAAHARNAVGGSADGTTPTPSTAVSGCLSGVVSSHLVIRGGSRGHGPFGKSCRLSRGRAWTCRSCCTSNSITVVAAQVTPSRPSQHRVLHHGRRSTSNSITDVGLCWVR